MNNKQTTKNNRKRAEKCGVTTNAIIKLGFIRRRTPPHTTRGPNLEHTRPILHFTSAFDRGKTRRNRKPNQTYIIFKLNNKNTNANNWELSQLTSPEEKTFAGVPSFFIEDRIEDIVQSPTTFEKKYDNVSTAKSLSFSRHNRSIVSRSLSL